MLKEMDYKMTKTQFCSLITTYEKNLFRLAKSILHNDADAEDAVGEAILKSYAALPSLKDESRFKPWLFRILVNEAYAAANRRRRVVYLEDNPQAEQTDSGDRRPDTETELVLWQLVNSLEEEYRIVTVLFYYEDFSLKDIATALELPEGTVKSRLSRARVRLKAMLADEGERENG